MLFCNEKHYEKNGCPFLLSLSESDPRIPLKVGAKGLYRK